MNSYVVCSGLSSVDHDSALLVVVHPSPSCDYGMLLGSESLNYSLKILS